MVAALTAAAVAAASHAIEDEFDTSALTADPAIPGLRPAGT